MQRYLLILLALFCLGLSGCSGQQDADAEQKRSLLLFGTIIEITLYGADEVLAQKAFTQLETDFARWHQDWSPWTDGELAQLNRQLAAGSAYEVDPELRELIQAGADISTRSQGLFNPAIGKLINLWQFHRSSEPDIRPPEDSAIRTLVDANPGMADLAIQGDTISSRNPAVQLSLGAYAKGYAIDIALATLQSMGIENAVINAGGDLKVIGHHGSRDWRVGIRHPRRAGVLGWLDVQPAESVFTSGDYERFYMYQGKRMHHILDPRSGYPAHGLSSVTVLHADASLADAAATALFVAGPVDWPQTARALGIEYAMLVDVDGNIQITPAMAERVHFMDNDEASRMRIQPL